MAGAIDATLDSGVEHGRELVSFAGAVAGSDVAMLTANREKIAQAISPAAVVTASLIAANFSMLDRAANGVGISLDSMILKTTAGFRAEMGINAYPSAANTPGAV